MTKKNVEKVRTASRLHNVALWKVADVCGWSQATMTRKLRHEIDNEEADRLIQIIKRIAEEGE